ncbi:hypothetical protein [Nonlabens agnitus]|uniref:General secretion pathway protein n=1 Tax=Nonlabens agnitus TaxID=870484 RepID=A0A2S9WQY1_9FLAO|nr:hypothetical protein [Nonlabens agnitus]PRP65883.1 hypothetical protein BST86_01650 [Nonlabens agnitus]
MIITKLLNYHFYHNTYNGIEVSSINGTDYYYFTSLKKSKGEIKIVDQFEVSCLKELEEKIDKNIQANLVLTTSNILYKVSTVQENEENQVLRRSFPDIDVSQFNYEISTDQHQFHLNIIRKDQIDNILNKLRDHKVTIINLSIGFRFLQNIIPFMKGQTYHTSRGILSIDEEKQLNLTRGSSTSDNTSHDINGINVSDAYLMSFAAALQSIIQNPSITCNLDQLNDELKSQFQRFRLRKSLFLGMTVTTFLILLINFVLYSTYFDQTEKLKQKSIDHNIEEMQMSKLTSSVQAKEVLMSLAMSNGSSQTSKLLYTALLELPKSIELNELVYQPLTKMVKPTERILYENNTMTIKGFSGNNMDFTRWYSFLENLEEVSQVEVIQYGSQNLEQSEFTIKISIHEKI